MWSSYRKTSRSMIILIIFCLIVTAKGASRIRRIIGGAEADESEFPFNVRLEATKGTNRTICGGAIITDHHILTAGHCLENADYTVVVYCGIINVNDPGIKNMSVERTIIHPDYVLDPSKSQIQKNDNDIGIIVLKNSLTFNKKIMKIPLVSKPVNRIQKAILAGWGSTGNENEVSNVLRKMEVMVLVNIPNSTIEPYQFLGVNITGDGCSGDSGSPLITPGQNPVLLGIFTKSDCVPGRVQHYTNVYEYRSWIFSVIPDLASGIPKLCRGCSVT